MCNSTTVLCNDGFLEWTERHCGVADGGRLSQVNCTAAAVPQLCEAMQRQESRCYGSSSVMTGSNAWMQAFFYGLRQYPTLEAGQTCQLHPDGQQDWNKHQCACCQHHWYMSMMRDCCRVKAVAAMAGFKACSSKSSEPACAIMHSYVSSELEQAWLDNIGTWQNAFCSSFSPTEQLTQVWLKAQAAYDAALQKGSQNPVEALQQQQLLDPRVFSQFKTKVDCGSSGISEQITWIEPLAHGLRHPDSLCNRGTTVFNRTYLVPAHSSEVRSLRDSSRLSCQGRECQNIYLDLGATTLVPGPGEPGQGWFFYTYAKQDIVFDRFLLWEAKPRSPEEVFKHVPKPHLDRYQYYNIPVSADTADPSSPINVLKVGPNWRTAAAAVQHIQFQRTLHKQQLLLQLQFYT